MSSEDQRLVDVVREKIFSGQDPTHSEVFRASRGTRQSTELTVTVAGNVGTDFLVPGLRVGLAAYGVDATVTQSDYDNWQTEALGCQASTDWWVIWLSSVGATRGGIARPDHDVVGIRAACERLLALGSRIILVVPEPLQLEEDPFSPFGAYRRELVQKLDRSIPDDVIRLSIDHLQRRLGSQRWFASRYWTLAKAPCHPEGMTLVAIECAKTLAQARAPRVKAVICDLDNTLWGGVVGDDGPNGLELDPFGEGIPFLALQRLLKDVQASGIPLSVVSKNERENALEPFRTRSEMILQLDDFVHFDASWLPKHIGIREIAAKLNLGLDSLCFLDDSAHEREEARSFIPELIVPDLSADPSLRVSQLLHSGLFLCPVRRQDDVERSRRYREDLGRQVEMSQSMSREEYLRDLNMRLTPIKIGPENISRVEALIQKTNQFNLSNKRHSIKRINSFVNDKSCYAYCYSLSDRIGDSGIISVVLASPEAQSLVLDTWVLSCRVFGRQVELAILDNLLQWTRRSELSRVQACWAVSRKNAMVGEFLKTAGFRALEESEAGGVFIRDNLSAPDHRLVIAG